MSCAKGSIACPAIAGIESIMSSFWTLGVRDWLAIGGPVESLKDNQEYLHVRKIIIIITISSKRDILNDAASQDWKNK
jgi:hypothetical protein